MKTIYFVRHGQCQANADGRIAGSRNDSPLTQLGIAQADETGEKLLGMTIDLVATSPLRRSSDTARLIADKIGYKGEIRVEPLLQERDFGAASGEISSIGFPLVDAEQVDELETLGIFAERMRQALDVLATLPGKQILVVGHSGAERMMRTIYDGRPYQDFLQTEVLSNGMIREYRFGA